jgi:hypothetical protein
MTIMQRSRRNFLKKAVYRAPALILLGTLTRPKNACADYSGGPPGPPGDWGGWSVGGKNTSGTSQNRSASPMKVRKRLKF